MNKKWIIWVSKVMGQVPNSATAFSPDK